MANTGQTGLERERETERETETETETETEIETEVGKGWERGGAVDS